jgi:hypothetical protein
MNSHETLKKIVHFPVWHNGIESGIREGAKF